MKSLYTGILSSLFYFTVNATTWQVTVANFTFSPATVNAMVGDVIQFNWSSGTHTTTCGGGLPGTSLPAGAAGWNNPMTSEDATFSYTLTVAGNYLYGCIPHFVSRAMSGNIIVSSPLPVKFGSFTVNNNNNKALLQWKTLTEMNTKYFSIRKSIDGINFSEIAKVNAAGNSNLTVTYQFEDQDLGKIYKYLYYEIVIIDVDKKESHSVIETFRNNDIVKDNLIVSISPNPVTGMEMVQLKFNADRTGEMDVSVFNNTGQMVLKTKMAAFYGLNNSHLHICDLGKGTYHIIFSLDGKKETKKVVVL